VPDSWRDYYKFNPCVPVDFSTVSGAFSVVRSPRIEQLCSIRVLLRPGRYVLRDAITVQAPRTVRVEIETMEMPESFLPIDQTTAAQEVEPARKRKSSQSLRNILACRTVDVEDPEDDFGTLEFFEPTLRSGTSIEASNTSGTIGKKRATLVLRTRRHNEPIIRVRQGTAVLRNLELRHVCHGIGKSSFYMILSIYYLNLFLTVGSAFPLVQTFGMETLQFRFSLQTAPTTNR